MVCASLWAIYQKYLSPRRTLYDRPWTLNRFLALAGLQRDVVQIDSHGCSLAIVAHAQAQ